MENLFNKTIKMKQQWCSRDIEFDPDSSPNVWQHYKRVYNDYFGKTYKIDQPCFCSYVLSKECKVEDISCGYKYNGEWYNYVDKPYKNCSNRLYAISREASCKEYNGHNYYKTELRLGGDTDFNFNEKHFPYIEWVLCREEDLNVREKSLSILEECKKKHHTFVNFSLMQAVGRMQNFKGAQCEDRLDKFLFFLDRYFQMDKKNRFDTSIIQNATETNRKDLEKYLNSFASFADYCKKIYFIEDEEFIKKLVKSGKQPIDTPERVREYLNLAKEFWKIKEKKYLDIYCPNYIQIRQSLFSDGGKTYTLKQLEEVFKNNGVDIADFPVVLEIFVSYGWIMDCGNNNYTK